ncbi:MAG: hypothetical protein EXR91_00620 [Gemmatimonadetes bacterium]|nr:hypothetical protein [Gemmatimonadota bacterium]
MSLSEFLGDVTTVLDNARVSYILTGSLAAAYYAAPRATQDVDLVIEVTEAQVEAIVRGLLSAGCYVDREAALVACRVRGQFNAIDPRLGWKLDLIVRKDRPYSVEEFSRRHRGAILGVDMWLATLEDIVISKLEWSRLGESERQRRDVVHLLERGWQDLDREYVERWVAELGLEAEWKRALSTRTP